MTDSETVEMLSVRDEHTAHEWVDDDGTNWRWMDGRWHWYNPRSGCWHWGDKIMRECCGPFRRATTSKLGT